MKRNHFKARVQLLLRQRGMTMTDLARVVGKNPQGLRDILQRGNPKLTVLREFSSALRVPITTLIKPVDEQEYGKALMPRS